MAEARGYCGRNSSGKGSLVPRGLWLSLLNKYGLQASLDLADPKAFNLPRSSLEIAPDQTSAQKLLPVLVIFENRAFIQPFIS